MRNNPQIKEKLWKTRKKYIKLLLFILKIKNTGMNLFQKNKNELEVI